MPPASTSSQAASAGEPTAPEDASAEDVSVEEVSAEDVRHLAELARLDVTEEETEALAGDLRRLLGYARHLGEVDTAGVEPMAPGAPAATPAALRRLRRDKPEKPLSQKEALEDAPDAEDGFFRMPGALKE